mmetsp:Transcript_31705/g.78189  ORF Transcript_31705/g.78189 Transcript_31705/m.78189 type:complete len:334 (+) Transcript_31705:276-1277(+)
MFVTALLSSAACVRPTGPSSCSWVLQGAPDADPAPILVISRRVVVCDRDEAALRTEGDRIDNRLAVHAERCDRVAACNRPQSRRLVAEPHADEHTASDTQVDNGVAVAREQPEALAGREREAPHQVVAAAGPQEAALRGDGQHASRMRECVALLASERPDCRRLARTIRCRDQSAADREAFHGAAALARRGVELSIQRVEARAPIVATAGHSIAIQRHGEDEAAVLQHRELLTGACVPHAHLAVDVTAHDAAAAFLNVCGHRLNVSSVTRQAACRFASSRIQPNRPAVAAERLAHDRAAPIAQDCQALHARIGVVRGDLTRRAAPGLPLLELK